MKSEPIKGCIRHWEFHNNLKYISHLNFYWLDGFAVPAVAQNLCPERVYPFSDNTANLQSVIKESHRS